MMTSYFTRRVGAALSHQWFWLLLPVVAVMMYLGYSFVSATEYLVHSEVALVTGKADAKDSSISEIPPMVVGGVVPMQTMATLDQLHSEWPRLRDMTTESFQQLRDTVARNVLAEPTGNEIKLSYRGNDKELGRELLQRLASSVASRASSVVSQQLAMATAQQAAIEQRRQFIASEQKRLEALGQPATGAGLSPNEVADAARLNDRIAVLKNVRLPVDATPVKVEGIAFQLTDSVLALAFKIFVGLLLLVLLGLVISEFSKRSLTTEKELANYLNIRVFGALPLHAPRSPADPAAR